MKLITAFIQPEKLTDVKKALYEKEIFKMSVSNVRGCGQQRGFTETYRGVQIEVNLLEKVRIDIALNDNFLEPAIEAITEAARTGAIGDGKIFVVELADCVQIRTGERGTKAI